MHNVHPYWVSQNSIEMSQLFSPNARVEVTFPEQLPMLRRGQIVKDLKTEVEAGFISRESAMKKLNPEWTEKRLDEELAAIENPITLEVEPETTPEPKPEDDDDGSATTSIN